MPLTDTQRATALRVIGYSPYLPATKDHGQGAVRAWWFRWNVFAEPGCYIVTVSTDLWDYDAPTQNYSAVMDDFGNLRKVQ